MKTMTYVQIAKLCHKVNKEYCQSLGDDSQPSWGSAPEWQKDSAIKGVEFHMTTKEASPRNSHESWLKEKEANGWVYGETKDPELKTHPCMVPYEKLPLAQRSKDHIFKAICDFFKDEFFGVSYNFSSTDATNPPDYGEPDERAFSAT